MASNFMWGRFWNAQCFLPLLFPVILKAVAIFSPDHALAHTLAYTCTVTNVLYGRSLLNDKFPCCIYSEHFLRILFDFVRKLAVCYIFCRY